MRPGEREITFLGIPITAVNPDVWTPPEGGVKIHMLMRVEDEIKEPYPALVARRKRTLCEGCNAVCWIDPKCMIIPTAKQLCSRCALARMGVPQDKIDLIHEEMGE